MSNELSTYLTFRVIDHHFGVSVDKVMEISEYKQPKPIPESPAYMLGVVEFRDQVIPLIDTAQKFNLPPIDINPLTCVVVLELENIDLAKKFKVAILVDAVSDVFEADDEEIKTLSDDFSPEYIKASHKTENGLVMILDADKVFSVKDVITLDKLIVNLRS